MCATAWSLPRRAWGLVALALVPILAASACSREPKRPNVLLITLDTTRADALGCYGGNGASTPNLDALAAEGTRFDTAIATASLTPVSHASILTGLDNARHGVRVLCAPSGCKLRPDVPTLATILSARGWSTFTVQSAFPVSSWFGLDRGFTTSDELNGSFVEGVNGGMAWDQHSLQRRADVTTDRALALMASTTDPFCAWVHYWDPHDNSPDVPASFLPPDVPRDEGGALVRSRPLYAAKVSYVDDQIGRLVRALRDSGRWDDTIVVVVADHGEGMGDHDWPSHRILYQEQIRVPLIVRVPPRLAGRAHVAAVTNVVRTTDILPTILDYAGVDVPADLSGHTLRTPIEGGDEPRRLAFADEINGYDLNCMALGKRPVDDFGYVVIDYPWKLVYRPLHLEHNELFDLSTDPRELTNLLRVETERVRYLELELAQHGGFVTQPFADDGRSSVRTEAATHILSTLGYTQGQTQGIDARFAFECPKHRRTSPNEPFHESPRCAVCRGPCLPVRHTY